MSQYKTSGLGGLIVDVSICRLKISKFPLCNVSRIRTASLCSTPAAKSSQLLRPVIYSILSAQPMAVLAVPTPLALLFTATKESGPRMPFSKTLAKVHNETFNVLKSTTRHHWPSQTHTFDARSLRGLVFIIPGRLPQAMVGTV